MSDASSRHSVSSAVDALSGSTTFAPGERAEVVEVMTAVEHESGRAVRGERALALAAHTLSFVRRLRSGERLEGIAAADFPEIPADTIDGLRRALQPFCGARDAPLADEEVFLFATHVEAARLGG